MRKIKDRFVLGLVAGFAGNLVKSLFVAGAESLGLAENTEPKKAAGMLTRRAHLPTGKGKVLGRAVDSLIGSILGIGNVYMLSLTGKDYGLLKGAVFGEAAWLGLYGALSSTGVTSMNKAAPVTNLVTSVSHVVYGLATSAVAVALGDPDLFTGEIPLIVRKLNREGNEYATRDGRVELDEPVAPYE